MITARLAIRFGSEACRETSAWYLPGSSPDAWLNELSDWTGDQVRLRVLVIPRSSKDRSPRGALVFGGAPSAKQVSRRCSAYGCLASRLFLPVEARLVPEVADKELGELLSEDRTYVWHPAVGLVAFEPTEILGIADLLCLPAEDPVDWHRADPGMALAGNLRSVLPDVELSAEPMLQSIGGDIGDDSDQLDQLPPRPDEPPTGWLRRAIRQGQRRLIDFALGKQNAPTQPGTGSGAKSRTGSSSKSGSGSNSRTSSNSGAGSAWGDKLRAWAERQRRYLNTGLETARARQLHRLLHMLDNDPDQGLRYALPLENHGYRGRARPGSDLTPHGIDFRLAGLEGGGAADSWFVPPDMLQALLARYRQLAERELQLGRHRRAAYILAELIGDLHGAAAALRSGRHWREAAAVYAQKLKTPRSAAECLAQGGLLLEAIEVYRKIDDLESVGDLYTRLEQPERAEQAYRQVMSRLLTKGQFLEAAQLAEHKLHVPEEAVEHLKSGWPHSPQAAECARGVFRLLGFLGRHEDARTWVDTLTATSVANRLEPPQVAILAEAAAEYPDAAVREVAADTTRVLVARHLCDAPPTAARSLLAALAKLAPHDRLLLRDCQRFGDTLVASQNRVRSISVSHRRKLTLLRSFLLPIEAPCVCAVAGGGSFYVAGFSYRQLRVKACPWRSPDSPNGTLTWPLSRSSQAEQVVLCPPAADRRLLVHLVGGPKLAEQPFPHAVGVPHGLTAGPAPGMGAGIVGLARTAQGRVWMLQNTHGQGELAVLRGNNNASVVGPIAGFGNTVSTTPVPMHARREAVFLAQNNRLLTVTHPIGRQSPHATSAAGAIVPREFVMSSQIVGLTGAPQLVLSRVAITFEVGGMLYWDRIGHAPKLEPFATDMRDPIAGFNRGGLLIAANRQCSEVYSTRNGHLRLLVRGGALPSRPIAILAAPAVDQFCIVTERGDVLLFEVKD